MTRGPADRARRGVTYVELLIVATMAAVVATVAIPTGLIFVRAWKERQLKRSLAQIRVAIDAYHADWEKGCIEAEDEKGWPESLEELTEEKDLVDDPACTGEEPAGATPEEWGTEEPEPPKRRYLARLPPDPFNAEAEEHDTAGWNARSYDDEIDSSTWKGEGVYDVYSSSALTALDGTKYEQW